MLCPSGYKHTIAGVRPKCRGASQQRSIAAGSSRAGVMISLHRARAQSATYSRRRCALHFPIAVQHNAHGPRTPKHGDRYRKWTGAWPFSFFGASKACQNHAKYIVDVAELQCSRRRSSIHGRDSHTSDITLCRKRKEGPRCTPVLPATTSQQFASLVQRHKTMCHARARDERTGHRDCSVCPLTCL